MTDNGLCFDDESSLTTKFLLLSLPKYPPMIGSYLLDRTTLWGFTVLNNIEGVANESGFTNLDLDLFLFRREFLSPKTILFLFSILFEKRCDIFSLLFWLKEIEWFFSSRLFEYVVLLYKITGTEINTSGDFDCIGFERLVWEFIGNYFLLYLLLFSRRA